MTKQIPKIRIAVVIPDRGDRPSFLKNCLRMVNGQTLYPSSVHLMDYKPKSNEKDITQRYRIGYSEASKKGCDVIAFMENDDWYAVDYLEKMAAAWIVNGKPDIFGTDETIYYNLNEKAWKVMHHVHRSSAMSTLVRPNLKFDWCVDNEPYTDIHLWRTLKGVTHHFDEPICLGIKHGVGLCGGALHVDRLHQYVNKDPEMLQLKNWVDSESFYFYKHDTP